MATRKYIDCREHPDPKTKCTVAISADSEEELLKAVVQHGVAVHGMKDSPDLRKELKTLIREGEPVS
jgi:predicted small metal-binding protein